MKALRPHQERAKAMLRASIGKGRRRPMLQLPTGAGKTFVAADIFRSARERNPDVRLLFIVDAVSLIDQTVEALYAQGLYGIGVIQADHMMTDWSKPIQVASVQTLQRRKMPEADIVIVDEAHRQNEWLQHVMASDEWAKVPFIGLSATPWSKGLGNHFDDLLMPVSMQELIDQGFLSPFRVFAAAHPDLGGVKVQQGDYATGQLSDVMSEGALIADIVDTWKLRGEYRPTFAFCVDRAHAKKVQRKFEDAGVPCGYIDAYTEVPDRVALRAKLEAGEVKVSANVGCLTTGVDWPVGCIILARPTKSEMLYVQMIGRGLRVNDGMNDCVILDHADNTLRLGFVTDSPAQHALHPEEGRAHQAGKERAPA
jgi:DNA repair protein RadD